MALAITNPTVQTGLAPGITSDTLDWSSVHSVVAVQLKSTAGGPSGQIIQLKGSLDGVNYYNLGATITTVGGMTFVSTTPFRYTQVTNTISGGSSPTIDVAVGVGP